MATAPNTNIIFPQSPFLDPMTGRPAREWMMWLMNPSYVGVNVSNIVPVIYGGTGLSSIPANGQLLIGNGTGYSLNILTAGQGITVTNLSGGIAIKVTDTAVTAGTYGNAGNVPTITVNSRGQLTTVTTNPISITSANVTGGATGTFKSGDAVQKTITVTNGIITSIV
jgi:hypothetical protein